MKPLEFLQQDLKLLAIALLTDPQLLFFNLQVSLLDLAILEFRYIEVKFVFRFLAEAALVSNLLGDSISSFLMLLLPLYLPFTLFLCQA